MKPYELLAIAALVIMVGLLMATMGGGTSAAPPDPFPREMFELSYDRHANTPKWVKLCEAKLEWRLKELDWRKRNSRLSSEKATFDDRSVRNKAALDASRAGKRCEIPSYY